MSSAALWSDGESEPRHCCYFRPTCSTTTTTCPVRWCCSATGLPDFPSRRSHRFGSAPTGRAGARRCSGWPPSRPLALFLWRWGQSAAGVPSAQADGASEQDGGAADAEVLAAQGARQSDTPKIRAPLGAGYSAVAWLVVAAAVLLLGHHARVPLTDLHQAWTFGTIRYWKPVSPPTRAWPAENGLWTGGHDTVELLLSSPEPLELIVFELDTLAPMQADNPGRQRPPDIPVYAPENERLRASAPARRPTGTASTSIT